MFERTFLRFLLVGLGNTALGLAVIFGFRLVVGEVLANLLAYLLLVPIAFLTQRRYAFRDGGGRLGGFLRFLPVVATAYALNMLTLMVFLDAGSDPRLAQIVAISVYAIASYWLSRRAVFRSPVP